MAASTMTATNSAGYASPAALVADPVIFTVIDDQLHVLLSKRIEEPFLGDWALPGGFVGNDDGAEENPEDTVQRKLTEKTAVGDVYMEQLRTYGTRGRDPRGWIVSIAYIALVNASVLPATGGSQDAAWFAVNDLPDLAFDHQQMILDGVERLQGKLWYSNVAVGLLPKYFSLQEAYKVYCAISGKQLDKSNFRRDLQSSKLVKPTTKTRSGRGPAAKLWRFASQQPAWSPTRRGA